MRRAIRFYLGDTLCEPAAVTPGLTVLDWLREHQGRTGTKEGCNEGDCGACTVIVVRREGEGLAWRAVNACIHLVAMLDGAQLFTVEDLAEGRALHPVQQAMVDQHGAQCGFCTPGFVMSMAAYRMLPDASEDDAEIDAMLAGNLCRCTGYAPIVRAMKQALGAGPDRLGAMRETIMARLVSLDDRQDVVIETEAGRIGIPASADALADMLARDPEATIIAGATDVGLWITKGLRSLPHVIVIGQIAELRTITSTAAGLRIGAAVTYERARSDLAAVLPGADDVIGRIGSVQVRNAGTVCGNIANGSPIGDGPPVLIAAGALLHLRRDDHRRTVPLEAYFIAYGQQDRERGEFVEAVTIPPQPPGRILRAYKVSKRADQDISAVLGAFALDIGPDGVIHQARLAFGGMAATPRRAAQAEAALIGRLWDRSALDAARSALGRDFTPLSDMRATDWYRRTVAANLLTRFFEETRGGAPARLSRVLAGQLSSVAHTHA